MDYARFEELNEVVDELARAMKQAARIKSTTIQFKIDLEKMTVVVNGTDFITRMKNWEVVSSSMDTSDVDEFKPSERLKDL